jgi:hypothetical protein
MEATISPTAVPAMNMRIIADNRNQMGKEARKPHFESIAFRVSECVVSILIASKQDGALVHAPTFSGEGIARH